MDKMGAIFSICPLNDGQSHQAFLPVQNDVLALEMRESLDQAIGFALIYTHIRT